MLKIQRTNNDEIKVKGLLIGILIGLLFLFFLTYFEIEFTKNNDIKRVTIFDIEIYKYQTVEEYTKDMTLFATGLWGYWIILLFIFEIDKTIPVSNINEEELFEKYNPMLAGCFEGSRDILPKDIIAVILNLVEKNYIKLDIKKDINGGYKYFVKKLSEYDDKLDNIEKFVSDWFFENNNEEIDLIETLKLLPQKPKSAEKFKLLNIIVQEELNKKGANKNKVPFWIRMINTVIYIIAIFMIIRHLNLQGLLPDASNSGKRIFSVLFSNGANIVIIISLVYAMVLQILRWLNKFKNVILQKISKRKIVTTIMKIIILEIIVIAILIINRKGVNYYLFVDLILFFISSLIVSTDNLMVKNEINRVEDYSRLILLKEKIINYTLLSEKEIEHIVLWDKYLVYAISFGITTRIHKKIVNVVLNDEIMEMFNGDIFNSKIISGYFEYHRNFGRIQPKK